MEKNKTKLVTKNSIVGLVIQAITVIASFVARTIFIKLLGSEYLGINGLFSDILTMLSLAELGVGSAITFKIYKPLVDGDNEAVGRLMHFFKKCYTIIGLSILLIGGILTPFLPYLINGNPPEGINIYVIFLLYVVNSSSTYFFAHKSAFIEANQEKYINEIVLGLGNIAKEFLYIVILLVTKNFYLYVSVNIFTNVACYLILSFICDKKYPWLKTISGSISGEEKKAIFKDIFSLMIYKLAVVILNGTDNIIISKFIGLSAVAILSNYTLIKKMFSNFLGKITSAFSAPLAQHLVHNSADSKIKFYQIFLIFYFFYAVVSIGMFCFYNDVIDLWLGEEYLFSIDIVFAICFYFYIDGTSMCMYLFRTSLGLFKEGKISPVLASIINIILSLILAQFYGVFGVLIATSITRLVTYFIFDPIFVFRKAYSEKPFSYYAFYLLTMIYTIGVGALIFSMKNFVFNTFPLSILSVGIQVLVYGIVISCLIFLYLICFPSFRKLFNDVILTKIKQKTKKHE